MARDALSTTSLANGFATTPFFLNNPSVHTWVPANDIQFTLEADGKQFVLIYNADAGNAVVTMTSSRNSFGRSTFSSTTIAAGDYAIVGPFDREGWEQSGGVVHVDCDVAVEALVVRLP